MRKKLCSEPCGIRRRWGRRSETRGISARRESSLMRATERGEEEFFAPRGGEAWAFHRTFTTPCFPARRPFCSSFLFYPLLQTLQTIRRLGTSRRIFVVVASAAATAPEDETTKNVLFPAIASEFRYAIPFSLHTIIEVGGSPSVPLSWQSAWIPGCMSVLPLPLFLGTRYPSYSNIHE